MHQHFYHHLPPNKVVKMVVWPALSFLKTQVKPKINKRERTYEKQVPAQSVSFTDLSV